MGYAIISGEANWCLENTHIAIDAAVRHFFPGRIAPDEPYAQWHLCDAASGNINGIGDWLGEYKVVSDRVEHATALNATPHSDEGRSDEEKRVHGGTGDEVIAGGLGIHEYHASVGEPLGSDWGGIHGMSNSGADCYANAVSQLCAPMFTDVIDAIASIRTPRNPTTAQYIRQEFLGVASGLRSSGDTVIDVAPLRDAVARYAQKGLFLPDQQEDAHEFLTFLLDALENRKKNGKKKTSFDAVGKKLRALCNWQCIEVRVCNHCKASNAGKRNGRKTDNFVMSVAVPTGASFTPQQAVSGFLTREEPLYDYNCAEICSASVTAETERKKPKTRRTKSRGASGTQTTRSTAPQLLLVHVKRWIVNAQGYWEKNPKPMTFQTSISFPEYDLSTTDAEPVQVDFQLWGILCHHGGLSPKEGHCVTYLTIGSKWFELNDNEKHERTRDYVAQRARAGSYIVGFKRGDVEDTNPDWADREEAMREVMRLDVRLAQGPDGRTGRM